MNRRQVVAVSVFLIGLVINPGYFLGCANDEVHFDYGEEEMLGLLDDINAAESWGLNSEGEAYVIEVSLAQAEGEDEMAALQGAAWAQAAHACGGKTRVFGSTASACPTVYDTHLLVKGTLRVSMMKDGESTVLVEENVDGEIVVDSHQFADGHLVIRLASMRGSLEMNGTTVDGIEVGTLYMRGANGSDAIRIGGELAPVADRTQRAMDD